VLNYYCSSFRVENPGVYKKNSSVSSELVVNSSEKIMTSQQLPDTEESRLIYYVFLILRKFLIYLIHNQLIFNFLRYTALLFLKSTRYFIIALEILKKAGGKYS